MVFRLVYNLIHQCQLKLSLVSTSSDTHVDTLKKLYALLINTVQKSEGKQLHQALWRGQGKLQITSHPVERE
jgi:hypothetical protein